MEKLSSPTTYDVNVDSLPVPGSSHRYVLEAIPRDTLVLEVGCATGYLLHWAKRLRGSTTVGIELQPTAAHIAKKNADVIVCGDAEDPLVLKQVLDLGPFGCIILSNVLEHTVDPGQLLSRLATAATPGAVWISVVPNVVHWSARIRALRGIWRYEQYGIFDGTHVRFWSAVGFLNFMTGCGHVVDRLMWTLGYSPRLVRLLRNSLPIGSGRWPRLDRMLVNLVGYEVITISHTGLTSGGD